jgi:hypothetical protein
MIHTSSPLRDAFLDDHKHLTRGLTRTLEALRSGDDARAIESADTMDLAVGPHMEFEETVFYPELAEILGEPFVEHLEIEHDIGKRAVQTILSHAGGEPLVGEERKSVIASLDTMLDHAMSCGTLMSHLDGLPRARKKKLLDRLLELRKRGLRWTEFERPEHPSPVQ